MGYHLNYVSSNQEEKFLKFIMSNADLLLPISLTLQVAVLQQKFYLLQFL